MRRWHVAICASACAAALSLASHAARAQTGGGEATPTAAPKAASTGASQKTTAAPAAEATAADESPEPGGSAAETPGHAQAMAEAHGGGAELSPHGAVTRRDSSTAAADLPAGTIEVLLRTPLGEAVANHPLELKVVRTTVAEGTSEDTASATTGADGNVRFEDQATSAIFQYQVMVKRDGGLFVSSPFQLRESQGQRVLLHLYPTTKTAAGMIGTRGIIAVHPRDDVFTVEMLYQIYNVGQAAWIADGIELPLPRGWKAFEPSEGTSDRHFVETDSGVELAGTYPPGQYEVNFRFQIPSSHEPEQTFRFALMPQLFDLRVVVESAPGMRLAVTNFPPAQATQARNGQQLLLTEMNFMRNPQRRSDHVTVRLSGLPVPGHGRIWATLIAVCTAAVGVWTALARRGSTTAPAGGAPLDDVKRAQKLLLNELVALERARQAAAVGPRTYDRTRNLLLDSLARLEALLEAPQPSSAE